MPYKKLLPDNRDYTPTTSLAFATIICNLQSFDAAKKCVNK